MTAVFQVRVESHQRAGHQLISDQVLVTIPPRQSENVCLLLGIIKNLRAVACHAETVLSAVRERTENLSARVGRATARADACSSDLAAVKRVRAVPRLVFGACPPAAAGGARQRGRRRLLCPASRPAVLASVVNACRAGSQFAGPAKSVAVDDSPAPGGAKAVSRPAHVEGECGGTATPVKCAEPGSPPSPQRSVPPEAAGVDCSLPVPGLVVLPVHATPATQQNLQRQRGPSDQPQVVESFVPESIHIRAARAHNDATVLSNQVALSSGAYSAGMQPGPVVPTSSTVHMPQGPVDTTSNSSADVRPGPVVPTGNAAHMQQGPVDKTIDKSEPSCTGAAVTSALPFPVSIDQPDLLPHGRGQCTHADPTSQHTASSSPLSAPQPPPPQPPHATAA
ncbi:hypothetical protein DIPPA_30407, partial [Diplonema papillatum]